MFIDTHAHLNFKAFKKDLDEVLNRAKESGVTKIIIPGAKVDSSEKAIEIAQRYDSCFAAIGIHPHHVDEFKQSGRLIIEQKLKEMLKQVQHDKIVAIGEIGLDYHEYNGYPPLLQENKEQQKELLLLQLDLAQKENLPIIFHCRNAFDDLLEIIRQYGKSVEGVFHCFDGEKKHLEEVLKLGFYIGFDGNITYPENQTLKSLVKLTPLERLFLETDSPFLTPQPFRGSRNEPAYITYIAKEVAEIHQRSVEEIVEMTSRNALNLFKI
ncbi:TatD family hydrolase [Candidatus Gottesmanbacteria bacterium]|nr:TatD family hydrolase [Candidatus Gottesmanbacteria bacterium]MBI5452304.1 TatD family hydrolase [Candidatus Gottesmanbacteria bacterium]